MEAHAQQKNLLNGWEGGGSYFGKLQKVHKVLKIPRVTITPLKKTHKTSSRDCSIVYDFDKLSQAAIISTRPKPVGNGYVFGVVKK